MWKVFCICIASLFFFFSLVGMNLVKWCNFWLEGYGAFAAQVRVFFFFLISNKRILLEREKTHMYNVYTKGPHRDYNLKVKNS
jgi:hypothetical protein